MKVTDEQLEAQELPTREENARILQKRVAPGGPDDARLEDLAEDESAGWYEEADVVLDLLRKHAAPKPVDAEAEELRKTIHEIADRLGLVDWSDCGRYVQASDALVVAEVDALRKRCNALEEERAEMLGAAEQVEGDMALLRKQCEELKAERGCLLVDIQTGVNAELRLREQHEALRTGVQAVMEWADHHRHRDPPDGTKQHGYVDAAADVHWRLAALLQSTPAEQPAVAPAQPADAMDSAELAKALVPPRSKEWWLAKAAVEGDDEVSAGSAAVPARPADAGLAARVERLERDNTLLWNLVEFVGQGIAEFAQLMINARKDAQ